MLMKLWNSGRLNAEATLEALIVPILSFGPLFMVIGLQGTEKTHGGPYLMDLLFTMVGALMLSIGLLFLFTRQVRIMRRLDQLENPGIRSGT